ncbi:hypothetical protein C8Q72DRAFT_930415 [Fomitopsis betulina]|nr:hypothetical protein C8Q72DRAFT_930415 [Fomitopsis betulina]
MAGPEGTKYRITLNNHTQNTPALGKPEYENTSAGKSNEAVWTSVVTINGVPYGRGSANTKAGAMELAAKQALDDLGVAY